MKIRYLLKAGLKDLRVTGFHRLMFSILAIFYFLNFIGVNAVFAQEPFYKGKTIRIIVGFSAGGGFDTYARALSRHLSRHIAGNPVMVVENMAGAGSLIAANHIYYVAKPDGLTLGYFTGRGDLPQLLRIPLRNVSG